MSKLLAGFWKDQSGATAIEYGLIAAGIALVIIGVVKNIGTKLIRRSAVSPSSLNDHFQALS
jgi:pilus assembly protein Flp/PilA